MDTLNKTAKNISDKTLFNRGGTLTPEEVKNFLNCFKYPYCKSIYKREILKDPDELKKIKTRGPVWYENRSGGVKFYTININSVPDRMNQRLSAILNSWENNNGPELVRVDYLK